MAYAYLKSSIFLIGHSSEETPVSFAEPNHRLFSVIAEREKPVCAFTHHRTRSVANDSSKGFSHADNQIQVLSTRTPSEAHKGGSSRMGGTCRAPTKRSS